MKLTIPAPVLAANRAVLGDLQQAAARTLFIKATIEKEQQVPAGAKAMLSEALQLATQARDGVANLGQGNLLDGTFQRYSHHAVRHLTDAVSMLSRPGLSKDGMAILQKTLFDAEVSTRLGSMAGVRSLEKPSPKALERAKDFSSGDGGSSSSSGGPVWVDGQWLDSLGNPVRGGGGGYTGPDGESYGWDGGPDYGGGRYDGGYTGPDGDSYSGI